LRLFSGFFELMPWIELGIVALCLAAVTNGPGVVLILPYLAIRTVTGFWPWFWLWEKCFDAEEQRGKRK
jgi:hypothetical protein